MNTDTNTGADTAVVSAPKNFIIYKCSDNKTSLKPSKIINLKAVPTQKRKKNRQFGTVFLGMSFHSVSDVNRDFRMGVDKI